MRGISLVHRSRPWSSLYRSELAPLAHSRSGHLYTAQVMAYKRLVLTSWWRVRHANLTGLLKWEERGRFFVESVHVMEYHERCWEVEVWVKKETLWVYFPWIFSMWNRLNHSQWTIRCTFSGISFGPTFMAAHESTKEKQHKRLIYILQCNANPLLVSTLTFPNQNDADWVFHTRSQKLPWQAFFIAPLCHRILLYFSFYLSLHTFTRWSEKQRQLGAKPQVAEAAFNCLAKENSDRLTWCLFQGVESLTSEPLNCRSNCLSIRLK